MSSTSTLIEVRPGTGGDDAAAFATDLAETIATYLTRQGHTVTTGAAGNRTVTLSTDASQSVVAWLSGTHRVQRVPRGSAARHTSTATVAVLAAIEARSEREQGLGEVRVDRYRGHGAGGQRKNKVSTAIRLTHPESGIVITRETGRSQGANLADAERDLAQRLASRDRQRRHQSQQGARRGQVVADRTAKGFTHNEQRSEVIEHATGRRWTQRKWERGLID